MQAVLQLFFDKPTDAFFRSLWQRVKDAGLPNPLLERGATPHITLSFGDDVDVDNLVSSLTEVLGKKSILELTFASLSTFANENGAIFVAPVVTDSLLDLHRSVQKVALNHTSSTSAYSQIDRWFPYCTLTMRLSPPQLLAGFALLDDLRLPISGQGIQVSLLEFPSLKSLASWQLGEL